MCAADVNNYHTTTTTLRSFLLFSLIHDNDSSTALSQLLKLVDLNSSARDNLRLRRLPPSPSCNTITNHPPTHLLLSPLHDDDKPQSRQKATTRMCNLLRLDVSYLDPNMVVPVPLSCPVLSFMISVQICDDDRRPKCTTFKFSSSFYSYFFLFF